jgi:hypothetical protein
VLPVGEGVQLVHEPLGVHPAQRVPVEGELAGVVGQDHRVIPYPGDQADVVGFGHQWKSTLPL